MTWPRLSFRQALAGVTLAGSLVAVLLASVLLVAFERARARRDAVRDLGSLAQVLGASNAAALAFDDVKAAEENLAGCAADEEIVAAALYRPDGRPFATFQRPGAEAPPREVREGRLEVENGGWVTLVRPIADDAGVHGYVYLKADTRQTVEHLRAFALSVFGVMVACCGAAFFLSARLQERIAGPLHRLADAAAHVANGGYSTLHLPSVRTREIEVLTDAFNEMVGQIQVRESALRAAKEDLEERVRERVHDLQREVKERQNAERALRVSESKFRGIVETTKDWIWSVDTDAVGLYNNPAVERILGYTSEEMLGRRMLDYVHPDDRGDVVKAFGSFVTSQSGWSGIVARVRHKNGQWRWVESTGTPVFDDQGKLSGFQGTNHDITERRVLEEQFRQSQKMEAVGRLAGGVAHDFNNLLGVILGYSELVLRKNPEPRVVAQVTEIRKAADRAAGLTRQLLAFSRKQVLAPKLIEPSTALADFGRMLPRLIGEDIHVSLVSEPVLGRVMVDPTQIDQVLMNLAINARDAMPQGGRLTLEASNRDLATPRRHVHGEVPPGSYVAIAVADTGCGMDTNVLSHLFEPFFTTKELGKGTGLGLPTVYGIVQQTGGHIEVESEPGRGTRFTIYLPRVPDTPPAAAPGPAVRRGGQETILLVEDEAALRGITVELLEDEGYRVLAASNGQEALEISRRHAGVIDLLLTDVVMPGLSGREVAERVALQRPGTRTLYISGYTADAIVHHGVADMSSVLLHKPFTSEALSFKVRELLGEPESSRARGASTAVVAPG
jgi:PAS domain S-box-containing protein